jgi:HJR/Mrr/RecB family endonuclease
MKRTPLIDLVVTYFTRRGYDVTRDVIWEGFSGISRRFDLVIRKKNMEQVTWIKDWKRTVGVNMIINIDIASADVGLSNPIVASEKFSSHARAYANRRGVTLITKREVIQNFR